MKPAFLNIWPQNWRIVGIKIYYGHFMNMHFIKYPIYQYIKINDFEPNEMFFSSTFERMTR